MLAEVTPGLVMTVRFGVVRSRHCLSTKAFAVEGQEMSSVPPFRKQSSAGSVVGSPRSGGA